MAFPIFDKLGGSEAALEVIATACGKRPTKFVQDKWRAKKSLPSKAAVSLILECQRRGIQAGEHDLRWSDEVAA
jgi:hypothetical protein